MKSRRTAPVLFALAGLCAGCASDATSTAPMTGRGCAEANRAISLARTATERQLAVLDAANACREERETPQPTVAPPAPAADPGTRSDPTAPTLPDRESAH